MAIADFSVALLGTDESTLSSSITSGSTLNGSEVNVLTGGNAHGIATAYLVYTATGTSGSIDVYLRPSRATGQSYTPTNPTFSVTPTNGTAVKVPLGQIVITSQYMTATVINNGIGSSITVSVLVAGQKFT